MSERTRPLPAARRVTIIGVLRDVLIDLRMTGPADGLVFPDTTAEHLDASSVRRTAHRAWQAAGLDPTGLHECPRTFASLMIAAGVNAKALSVYVGHAARRSIGPDTSCRVARTGPRLSLMRTSSAPTRRRGLPLWAADRDTDCDTDGRLTGNTAWIRGSAIETPGP